MYYLYRHVRPDKNQVFYVGVGTLMGENLIPHLGSTFRAYYRRAFQKKSRNPYWHNIVNKAGYEVEIMLESDSINFIKEKEKKFIQLYSSTLCNMTTGGDGVESYNHTEETKRRISNTMKGVKKPKCVADKINKAKFKPIIMYNNKEKLEFDSATSAAKYLGNINKRSNISSCLYGKRNQVNGYYFKFKGE
jgi:hypothetical protein